MLTANAFKLPVAMATIQANGGVIAANVMLSLCVERVREDRGKNRGRMVDALVLYGGTTVLGEAYCMRVSLGCWQVAADALGCVVNIDDSYGIEDTGGCLRAWHGTDDEFRLSAAAVRIQADVGIAVCKPGDVFIRTRNANDMRRAMQGRTTPGHAEIVIRQDGRRLITAGGNTTSGDSRDGQGFFYHPDTYTIDDPRFVGVLRPVLANRNLIAELETMAKK